MRVIDLGERWFAEGRASSTFIRVLLSWAFEGLGRQPGVKCPPECFESDRLELAQAAGLLEGYLSDDNADVIDCYLACWFRMVSPKDRPVEALRRARRLLSSDGSRTLVRELCRGVLESYPKNEAALPILQRVVTTRWRRFSRQYTSDSAKSFTDQRELVALR